MILISQSIFISDLFSTKTLQKLHLSDNSIGDIGCKYMSNFLKHNKV